MRQTACFEISRGHGDYSLPAVSMISGNPGVLEGGNGATASSLSVFLLFSAPFRHEVSET